MADPVYDRIGRTYAATRRPDPRIQAQIWEAIGDAQTIVNVGAGAGSYEPPGTILAVEPSAFREVAPELAFAKGGRTSPRNEVTLDLALTGLGPGVINGTIELGGLVVDDGRRRVSP